MSEWFLSFRQNYYLINASEVSFNYEAVLIDKIYLIFYRAAGVSIQTFRLRRQAARRGASTWAWEQLNGCQRAMLHVHDARSSQLRHGSTQRPVSAKSQRGQPDYTLQISSSDWIELSKERQWQWITDG